MTACIALLILGGLALFCYVREKIRAYSVRALFWKAAVSLLFLAVAVCAWQLAAPTRSLLGVFVILGLACGLLGDVWLDLKYVFPAEDTAFTYAGFLCFGIGHLCYMAGLLQAYSAGSGWYPAVAALLAALASMGNILLERPMKLHYGRMKPVVLIYGALLFGTVLISGSLALLHGGRAMTLNLFFVGAVLFALSDLVLSGTYFGEGKERPADLIANYILYYGGQFLIAFSLAFA